MVIKDSHITKSQALEAHYQWYYEKKSMAEVCVPLRIAQRKMMDIWDDLGLQTIKPTMVSVHQIPKSLQNKIIKMDKQGLTIKEIRDHVQVSHTVIRKIIESSK